MTFNELLGFVNEQDRYLVERFGHTVSTKNEIVFARMIKLMEELGELSNEVLASNGDQRADKLVAYDRQNLAHEVADVLIVTLLLAKSLDIDVKQALEAKIDKIRRRQQKDTLVPTI
ncbi:hypothetical protein KBD13_03095 [Patescibacteria group bacterium]|nr:hypothetical protein [Patescibacteria group bacterium]MDQ5919371.1 hypothetical protein [Patescibacteria group bacterium]